MYKIRHFFTSVSNLFKWLPTIWMDRQWDSHYYEVILLKKIRLQRVYFEKRQYFVGWENEVKWMKQCEYLLTMLIESKYWKDEWDNISPSDNGLDSRNKQYKEIINDREPGRWTGGFESFNASNKCYADIWEYKARRLFWLIFVWRYQLWWD